MPHREPRTAAGRETADAPAETASARHKKSDLRRRDLMDAGERTFLENGVAPTTIDDITRAAGVAKGTFYLYFDSKEALLAALRDRFISNCRERINALAARLAAEDWVGRLDAWVEGGIRHYLDHLELHDILYVAGDQAHGSMAQGVLVGELTELIRAGSAAGAWSVESPELVALFLFYGLHGVVDHIVTSRRPDRKAVIRLSQRMVRNVMGLTRTAGGRRLVRRS